MSIESKIYLDTNIFIYFFDRESHLHTVAEEVFLHIFNNNLEQDVSVVVYSEILSYPRLSEGEIEQYTAFFEETESIRLQEISVSNARTAAFLRRKYGIQLPDALILASAIESKATTFITADSRLKKVEEIEVVVLGDWSLLSR